ncbi:MAG: DUF4214 domain-containing protein, partial [Hyphomicrobiaceae bacterium]
MSIVRRRLLPAVLATALAASAAAQSGESPKGEARGGAAADAGGGIKPEPAGDLIWGANGHPLMSYPGTTYEQQLDYLKALGMTSYRVDISRLDQADRLARLVRLAKARGIEILPVITPALGLDKLGADELYAKAHALATSLVARFKGDIRVWELGNELETYAIIKACEMRDDGVQYNCAWGPAGGVGPLEYYGPRWRKVSAVLKGLSDGTTAVDPAIRKAMGTAGWGHLGAFARMKQDGIRWDISVWHMYGSDPEWAFKTLASFKRPIWVTEFNHPGGGQRSAAAQADGLVRAMTRLRQLQHTYNVEAAHVYELMDETYWAPSLEASMGLVPLVKDAKGGWAPGEPKPAFAAVKRMIAGPTATAGPADCHLNPYNRLSSPAGMVVSYGYCLVLGRPVDGQGLEDRRRALERDTPVGGVLADLLQSEELGAKHRVSAMSDTDYVRWLYRLLLGREPDGAGLASYTSALASGAM